MIRQNYYMILFLSITQKGENYTNSTKSKEKADRNAIRRKFI